MNAKKDAVAEAAGAARTLADADRLVADLEARVVGGEDIPEATLERGWLARRKAELAQRRAAAEAQRAEAEARERARVQAIVEAREALAGVSLEALADLYETAAGALGAFVDAAVARQKVIAEQARLLVEAGAAGCVPDRQGGMEVVELGGERHGVLDARPGVLAARLLIAAAERHRLGIGDGGKPLADLLYAARGGETRLEQVATERRAGAGR